MDTVVLGRTGLKVSVAGLGCGGASRIGLAKGEDHAAKIVRTAWDLGVTFFDTAFYYGTQKAVGKGLEGIPRDKYVLSTKFPHPDRKPEEFMSTLEEALRELRTDYIDIYHFHGLWLKDYARIREEYFPLMLKAREQGKIRFLGASEGFGGENNHDMFVGSFKDDIFDVMEVGYNLLNPSAAKTLFPLTIKNNIGVLNMFAVRKALHDDEQLKKDVSKILEAGQADPNLVKTEHTLDFLTQNNIAADIPEAAYRFCRYTPGVHVVLTGTGDPDHLKANIEAILKPKLPGDILKKLDDMFGRVDCVSGQ
jgi:aryl-alcohol dehydrogenase-like predicted oxidoreductase